MSNTPTQTLKGFRDFLPKEKRTRDFVSTKLKTVFERFGFDPLETPTLEYASLLTGKYGNEADKLLYTFTDSGDREIGLRYDQTVPTARILAQYSQELPKYFRRYQMQNVFRADKPQKGRYREFTQCDIDVFGSTDSVADAEIIACAYFSLAELGFKAPQIVVNDRQVLFTALKAFVTDSVDVFSIIQSVDKLDKKSEADVVAELVKKGLSQEDATKCLQEITSAEPTESLKEILSLVSSLGVPEDTVSFDPTIARGLDYYTGMIFEIKIPEYGAGSIGGGGRYDELIEKLGGTNVPAVGMSFGFDRLVEAVQALSLDGDTEKSAQVLVTLFGAELTPKSLEVAAQLRASGISTEVYPNQDEKLGKQFAYADKRQIPQVIVVGPNEIKNKTVVLKSMESGEQTEMTVDDAIRMLLDLQ